MHMLQSDTVLLGVRAYSLRGHERMTDLCSYREEVRERVILQGTEST